MEKSLFYPQTTKPISRSYSNSPLSSQNQEMLVKESSSDQNGSTSSLQKRSNPGPNLIRESSMPPFAMGNDEVDDIEDEESEFKMGRLIRQASLNSSQMAASRPITKVMSGSSSLPRYPLQKPEAHQEKTSNMRKFDSMNERIKRKNSIKIGKNNNSGAPTIPGGWVDKGSGSAEDMKAQIRFWARAVAFNVHQEC